MLRRLLPAIMLLASVAPARAAVDFSGFDITFEAGAGELQAGQSYSGTLTFPDEFPSSVSLYLLLNTSFFFCSEGVCDGDPNFIQEFVPLTFSQVGNALEFQFSIPAEECFQGDCDLFIPGQFQYDFDLAVVLYREPFVLIGDFSDTVAFVGTITEVTDAIPEPAMWAMLLLGFGSLGYAVRRGRSPVSRPDRLLAGHTAAPVPA